MPHKMRYRLALGLGAGSLGWAMIRLNPDNAPVAVIKTGVRIFPDGRNPKDGTDLAVSRNEIRAMRRRRDRLLKRKARMVRTLVEYGFFPADPQQRKALEHQDPYTLRAQGLDEALTPHGFGRALFHLNQRRGFRSNRRTDRKGNDSGALKTAIARLRATLQEQGCRTAGEWLYRRSQDGLPLRARLRQNRVTREDGSTHTEKKYDLYIDRAMIEEEFDRLWASQAGFHPELCTEAARADIKDVLFHQRPLKPARPGRCSLMPEEPRAPLALPSVQRIRMYQEVNALRLLGNGMKEAPLSQGPRDHLIAVLEGNAKRTIPQIRKLLGLEKSSQISLEDGKRTELKGNLTSAILSRAEHFGLRWFSFDETRQDAIVSQLVREENESRLVRWLQEHTGIDEIRAETIANVHLPEGYGNLSMPAVARILPELRREICSCDEAIEAAGMARTAFAAPASPTAEHVLPYYGIPLQRHVSFGSNDPLDREEIRYGRIPNPTLHIGLNQVRVVVNALIERYGKPDEIVIEVARELKQSEEERQREAQRRTERNKHSERCRSAVADLLGISRDMVKGSDIQKMLLWEELASDPAARRCPYSGETISPRMLLSDAVAIDHILPFSQTLDDSLNNKTVALRRAIHVKGNLTPWEAFGPGNPDGYDFAAILERAAQLPWNKRYRFGEDGYYRWLQNDSDFIARALNDNRYTSRLLREYLASICPQTRAISGHLTALLRSRLRLNDVLGPGGGQNPDDHRHHAINACVTGVTDAGLLQRLAAASAHARERKLDKLVDRMPAPWDTYLAHVRRAVEAVVVSHKPDHSHERAMHNDTAYGLRGDGRVRFHKRVDGVRTRVEDNLKVIEIASEKAADRHGRLPDGSPRPYKGYKGDSNFCIEIVGSKEGKWEGEVISTFEAYQWARTHGPERLHHPRLSLSGKPLVMRLMKYDYVRMEIDGKAKLYQVSSINAAGRLTLAGHHEANADARNRDKNSDWHYTYKLAGSLQTARARKVTVSSTGEMRDPGFREQLPQAQKPKVQKQNATSNIESGVMPSDRLGYAL